MYNEKMKFLDYKGLSTFLDELKYKYAHNYNYGGKGFDVEISKYAEQLQYSRGIGLSGLVKGSVSFNGSSNVTINTTADTGLTNLLSNYALKSDISAVLKFKDSKTSDELEALTGMVTGDVYHIKEGGSGTTYKVDSEYVYNGEDWIELGPAFNLPELSKVATTGNYEDLIDKTHGYIDSYVSLDSAKAVRAYMSSFYGDSAIPSLNGDAVDFDISLGYKYNVTYDGQTYTDLKCVGTDFNLENYGVPKTTIIGNTAMYTSANWQDWELMTDTFELPFLIIHERLKTSYKIWLFTATSGSHTIEFNCTGYPNDSDTLDENIDTTVHTVTLTTGAQKQFSVEIPGTYPGWDHNNDFYANNNPLGSNVNACNLTTGKDLIVTFDGVDYDVTSYRYYDTETYVSSGYGYTTYFVGNWKLNSLFAPLISTMSARGANTYNSIPDNTDDYPFCFSCTWGKPTGASATQMDNMLFATTAGNHTLSIRSTDSWSQLGPNYDQSSWDGGTFNLVGEVIPGTPAIYKVPEWFRGIDSFNQYEKDGETKDIFVEGNVLKVTYGNTEYELTVIKDASTEGLYCGNPGLSSYLEDESNDTPFLLLDGLLYLPDSVAGQLKEISGEVLDRSILKLDNRYLSEGVLQPDWEEDDDEAAGYIKNKPTLANISTSGSFSDLRYVPLLRSQWELSNVSLGIYEPVQYRHIDMYVKYGSGSSMVYTTPPAGTWVFVRVEYSTDGSYWSRWQSERIVMDGSSSFVRVERNTGHEGNLDITDILGDDTIQYFKVTALVVEASLTAGTGGRANEIGSVTFVKPRGQIADSNTGLVNGDQVYDYVEGLPIPDSTINALFASQEVLGD